MLHVNDALQRGTNTILFHTVDTDVIVVLVGQFKNIIDIYPNAALWVAFGTGIFFFCINTICRNLGQEKNYTASRYFTHSQDVIPHILLVKSRNQHGIPGMLIQM